MKEYEKPQRAQRNSLLKAIKKKVGLLINFNVERIKEGIKRIII